VLACGGKEAGFVRRAFGTTGSRALLLVSSEVDALKDLRPGVSFAAGAVVRWRSFLLLLRRQSGTCPAALNALPVDVAELIGFALHSFLESVAARESYKMKRPALRAGHPAALPQSHLTFERVKA
jgi:hypothetical protein